MVPSGGLEKRQELDRERLAQKKGERYACGPPGPAQGTEGLQTPHSLIILKVACYPKRPSLRELPGLCYTWPGENAHGTRMNTNDLFVHYIYT